MSERIIYGTDKMKSRIEGARPGDPSIYINFDAIRDLPDEYEAVISDVQFDPKRIADSFSDVTGKSTMWMPQPQLMYDIAEANGIRGAQQKSVEAIVEEVDINPMLMKPLDAAPTMRRMIVGRRVTKTSERLTEDGTWRQSSPCTIDYNVWERCVELWSKEEMWTDGYKKQDKYPPKYDTTFKRKAHFDSELKFAHAKAETKAYLKTIRELACLQTGYKTEALAEGHLYFCKIRRSREVLKLETAAHLQAISRGALPDRSPQQALFGEIEAPKSEPVFSDAEVEDIFDEPGPFDQPPPKQDTPRERLMIVIRYYLEKSLIAPKEIDGVKKMIKWLDQTPDADSDLRYATWWTKAVENLRSIEATLPKEARAPQHGLY